MDPERALLFATARGGEGGRDEYRQWCVRIARGARFLIMREKSHLPLGGRPAGSHRAMQLRRELEMVRFGSRLVKV